MFWRKSFRRKEKYGLKVVEDCAHAHGSELAFKLLGTFGDGGSFSFQTDKCISCGDGGFITANDAEIFENCGIGPSYTDENIGDIICAIEKVISFI